MSEKKVKKESLMDKEKEIEELENIIIHAVYGVSSPAAHKKAEAIYNAGYRNTTEFKAWLKNEVHAYAIVSNDYINDTIRCKLGQVLTKIHELEGR